MAVEVKCDCESGSPPLLTMICGLPDSISLVRGDRLGVALSTGSLDEVIICKGGNLFVRVVTCLG